VRRLKIVPTIRGESIGYRHEGGAAGELFTIVLGAIAAGAWPRLKDCPDCRRVFFDHRVTQASVGAR
jgi:hypothetical protein